MGVAKNFATWRFLSTTPSPTPFYREEGAYKDAIARFPPEPLTCNANQNGNPKEIRGLPFKLSP